MSENLTPLVPISSTFSLALDPTGEVYALEGGEAIFSETYADGQVALRI
jgi:hypothetical protein